MATGGVKSYNHVYPTTVKIESYTNSDEFELIECEKDMRGRDLKKKVYGARINSVLKWVCDPSDVAPFRFSNFVPFEVVLKGALEPSLKIRVFEFSLEHLKQKIEKHLDLSGDYKIFAVETKPSSSLPELVDEDNVKDICEKFSTYHLEVSGNLPVASGIRQRLGSNAALVREQVKIITRIDDEYDVMISYSWGTKDQVNDLYNALLDTFPGIKIWIDKERIQTDIFDGMTEGIVSSAVIIVCLSVPYLKSTNCQREIKYAGDLNRPLIPAYMFGPNDNVAEFRKDKKLGVPFFLTAGTLYADFKSERAGSPEWDGAFQVIVGQIRAKLPKFSPFSIENFKLPTIINLPEESKSSSRELLKLWLKPVDFRSTLEYFHGAFVDGTCKQMFDIILEWALSDDDSLIMWLNSGHGT
ncbi:cytokinesis protein 3, partial [Rhizoclosmatium hyalinum]